MVLSAIPWLSLSHGKSVTELFIFHVYHRSHVNQGGTHYNWRKFCLLIFPLMSVPGFIRFAICSNTTQCGKAGSSLNLHFYLGSKSSLEKLSCEVLVMTPSYFSVTDLFTGVRRPLLTASMGRIFFASLDFSRELNT